MSLLAAKATKTLTSDFPQQQQPLVADSIATTSAAGVLSFAQVPLPISDRGARQQLEMLKNEGLSVCLLLNSFECIILIFSDVSVFKDGDSSSSIAYASRISDDEIRKSLMVEAKRRKFWNSKKIDKMIFEEVMQCHCYHYVLESFTETRSTAEAVESSGTASLGILRGQMSDNSANAAGKYYTVLCCLLLQRKSQFRKKSLIFI